MDLDRVPLRWFGRRLPPQFVRRVIVLAPGDTRVYDAAEWRDTIVVIERGQIELEGLNGSRYRFGRGDVLWLAGLPLRGLHNCGLTPAVIVAIARRADRSGR